MNESDLNIFFIYENQWRKHPSSLLAIDDPWPEHCQVNMKCFVKHSLKFLLIT